MLDALDKIDRSLFLILNGNHNAGLDVCMWYASKMWFWLPVYATMLFFLYRKYPKRQFGIAIICVALLLFMTDFMVVHLFKNTVMRLRPSHQPELMDQVKLVKDASGNFYRGGRYGFFSNHASNYFGVATYFFLLMRPMKTGVFILLLVWVVLIAYSRIYLGVHYPGDVLAGAIYGSLIGVLMSFVFRKLLHKFPVT